MENDEIIGFIQSQYTVEKSGLIFSLINNIGSLTAIDEHAMLSIIRDTGDILMENKVDTFTDLIESLGNNVIMRNGIYLSDATIGEILIVTEFLVRSIESPDHEGVLHVTGKADTPEHSLFNLIKLYTNPEESLIDKITRVQSDLIPSILLTSQEHVESIRDSVIVPNLYFDPSKRIERIKELCGDSGATAIEMLLSGMDLKSTMNDIVFIEGGFINDKSESDPEVAAKFILSMWIAAQGYDSPNDFEVFYLNYFGRKDFDTTLVKKECGRLMSGLGESNEGK